MFLLRSVMQKSVSLRQRSKSHGRPRAPRRPGPYRPQVLVLEDRLPLGDALLGTVLGASWLASTLAVLDPSSAAAESATGRPAHRGPAQTVRGPAREGAGAQAAPASAFLEEARAALGPPATGTFAGPGARTSWEAASDPWPEWATLAVPAAAPVRVTNPALSQSGISVGGASGPVSGPPGHAAEAGTGLTLPLMIPAAATGPSDRALLTAVSVPQAQPAASATGPKQPNIVFIIADDMDLDGLQYMPRLQALVADQGVSFSNMFVTLSMCCPSHVSILTGQYPHNHHILENNPPFGGWQRFHDLGGENSTAATWLQDAGYYTARFGKYLTGYPDDSTYVPPGWDEWYVKTTRLSSYFNYTLNENGVVVRYGDAPEDYATDMLTAKVVDFIDRAEAHDAQPFFAFFAPPAPHGDGVPNGPALPAPRHAGMFAGATAPRPPSFNEPDMSDKPTLLQQVPLLTNERIAAIDHEYRTRIESLLALDESIEALVGTLAERGELENTYLFFTSDNGYHLGQHRLYNGKISIYEEDIRVPLIVRGPGVPAGVTRDHFALNIDFAPTFMELASATAGRIMDGRSLVPVLGDDAPRPHHWRQDFLVEIYRNPVGTVIGPNEIRALRTQDEIYVEWIAGDRELYDLRDDPYQLESQHDTAPPGQLRRLSRRLAELATCAGDSCRS